MITTAATNTVVLYIGNVQSLLHELALEVIDGKSWVISDGHLVLITPEIGGVRQAQGGGQITDFGLLAAKTHMPQAFLQASGKVQEEEVLQDGEVAPTAAARSN